MELSRKIGRTQQMIPIHFEVTRSKVKETVAFYAKTMFSQYLGKFMSDSHCTWQKDWTWSVDEHMNAEVKLK